MCKYAFMVGIAMAASNEPSGGFTQRHKRIWFISIGIGAVALATASIAAYGLSRGSDGWTTLRTGSYNGVAWQLDAQEKGGQLCLSVDSPRGPRDVKGGFAGACGFEHDPTKAADFYASGPGPDGSYVNFGPVPVNAVSVRVATNQVVPTYPMASGHGLPNARYWIDFEPSGWPSPAQGSAIDPRPLGAAGQPVPFKPY